MSSAGIRPVPLNALRPFFVVTLPNSLVCTMSRVVSFFLPLAQISTGRRKRRPGHQSGYLPVACSATS
jgi:hypothetical protein